jgi:hypothetical protein
VVAFIKINRKKIAFHSGEDCLKATSALYAFDKLFEKLTNDIESRLSMNLASITYKEANAILVNLTQIYGPIVKDFVNLIVLQAKNNVSEVIFSSLNSDK